MSSSRAPLITLCVLLTAAAAVVVGGVLLAKRETQSRKQVGREEISTFTDTLEDELSRLDALYEKHLVDLAKRVDPDSEIAIRNAGAHLNGLRQISIVPVEGHGIHAAFPLREGEQRAPIPVYSGNENERTGTGELFEFAPKDMRGWMGNWFYYYRFDAGYYVVISTDTEAVLDAMQEWVQSWHRQEFEPVTATGATVAFDGPQGTISGTDAGKEGTHQAADSPQPDLIIPLKSRAGRWRIAAWDQIETTASYHPPTLMLTSVLALGLMLLGAAAFFHQRKWHRVAEERVSFVNRVSHELRTPLTNILLNTDLAESTMGSAPEEAGRRLKLVREESERLSRLITNVLNFSRSGKEDAAELRAETIELRQLASSVLEPFRPALKRRGIKVELDLDSKANAFGDRDACAQILANLISNVEKYASSGGWMKIAARSDHDAVRLTVSDRGPGIPKGASERVFTAFERLGERVDEGVTGTGLGLAIARDLARRMGGEVRLDRRENSGAHFVVSLPAAPENVIGLHSERAAS